MISDEDYRVTLNTSEAQEPRQLETKSNKGGGTHLIFEERLHLRQGQRSVRCTSSEMNTQTDQSTFSCCHQMSKCANAVCAYTSRCCSCCRLCGPGTLGRTSSETACSPRSHLPSHTPTAKTGEQAEWVIMIKPLSICNIFLLFEAQSKLFRHSSGGVWEGVSVETGTPCVAMQRLASCGLSSNFQDETVRGINLVTFTGTQSHLGNGAVLLFVLTLCFIFARTQT